MSNTGLIPESFIETIIERSDICQYIGQIVSLKSVNQNSFKGLCPFHQEKTPSFHVHRDRKYFHCFGCGAHGNIINFLMQVRNLTFPDTIRVIAEDLGLEMPQAGTQNNNQYKLAYKVLANYSRLCQDTLSKHQNAQAYLNQRGLSSKTIEAFELGYASNYQGAEIKLANEIGIIHNNRRSYFQNRILFPIHNSVGKVVGFGGRSLNGSQPKYLNSKESFIFHKSKTLYGLYQAKKHKPKSLIVVEGYMDVISLHEHGIYNAVATLGTSITTNHISLLFKHTNKIECCFDGDIAGQKAAWKTLLQAMQIMGDGLEIKFIIMPDSEDPDSFVKKHGKLKWSQLCEDSLGFSEFFFHNLGKFGASSIEEKANMAKNGMNLLNKMPNSFYKQLMLKELEQKVGTKITEPKPLVKLTSIKLKQLEKALKIIIHNPELARKIELPELIQKSNDALCKQLLSVVEFVSLKGFSSMASLLAGSISHNLHGVITKYASMPFKTSEDDRLLENLTILILKSELELLQNLVRNEIHNKDRGYLKQLLQRKSVIVNQLNNHREQNNA